MNALLRYARLAAAALLASVLLCAAASAQNEFVTPTAGKTVVGVGNLCLNSSGQMVPMFDASGTYRCAGTGMPTTATQGTIPWITAFTDTMPNSANVTVVDTGSSSTAGNNSISIITGTPTVGSVASQAINGQSSVTATITGTWTGTLAFEMSADGGTTWVQTNARQRGSSYRAGTITGNGLFSADVSGVTNFRMRATAAMTGTAAVKFDFSASNGPVQIQNPVSVFDNTSNQQATIKPASTSALLTDTAAVVSNRETFAANVSSSITRSGNTTTYTANTGWNNGTPTVFTWTAACSAASKMILIPQISIYSSANPTLKLQGYLWIFKATPGTVIADNANFNIASSDYANLTAGSKGGIPFTLTGNQGSGATNSGVSLTGLNVVAQCASGAASLFGMVQVVNAYVPANAEVLNIDISTVGLN